jgi:hypothetical protein
MCAGEDAWNMAQSVIEDSRYNPYVSNPDCFIVVGTVFGAAINPVSRRGEHQVSRKRRAIAAAALLWWVENKPPCAAF